MRILRVFGIGSDPHSHSNAWPSKMEGAQELAAMRGTPNGQHQFFAAIWLRMVTLPRTAVILEACQREYRACDPLAFLANRSPLFAFHQGCCRICR